MRSQRQVDAILACPVEEACLGISHQFLHRSANKNSSVALAAGHNTMSMNNSTCQADGACLTYGFCAEGYGDRLCGQCMPGFYSLNNKCEVCPDKSVLQPLYMLLLVGIIVAGMLYAISQGMQWFKCGAIAILFDFVQLLGLYMGFELNWPAAIQRGLSMATLLNFNMDYLSPVCVVETTFYESWIMELLLPVFVLLGFVTLYVLYSVYFMLSSGYSGKQVSAYSRAFGQ